MSIKAESTSEQLQRENEVLRHQLGEAEATIRAISAGEVDAFIVRQGAEDQVLVLNGVDRPYRLLIERMHQGAATLSRDGTIVYSNRRFAELLGVPASTLLGAKLCDYLTPESQPACIELLKQGLHEDAERELALRRNDGTSLPAHFTASPLLDRDDTICLIVTDLTQQKRHERERERYIAEQAARAAAEQMAVQLRDADRRKDEFLAMLGHELRNPLAPLRNGIQALHRINSKEPAVQRIGDMMERQVDGLVRLVDDLLDVSRVTQGKIQLRKELCDLRDVVARAVEGSRPFIEEHSHQLKVTMPEGAVSIDGDVLRLTQVVTNLLNNAAKFTPQGGHIGVILERDAQRCEAVVRVRDSGMGIAPEMLPEVFDLFTQADPTLSRAEGGLGIGLTVARRLIEMHGGTLEAASPGLGQGSEFIIRLPAAVGLAPPKPSQRQEDGNRPGQTPSRRILVVDDNRDSAESLAVLLGILGHNVRHAFDGEQALALALDFRPEIVLLDIGLPGMSGYEVATRLRSQAGMRHVRIVAVSGYGSEEDRQRSHAAGFQHHLIKPLDLGALELILAAP